MAPYYGTGGVRIGDTRHNGGINKKLSPEHTKIVIGESALRYLEDMLSSIISLRRCIRRSRRYPYHLVESMEAVSIQCQLTVHRVQYEGSI